MKVQKRSGLGRGLESLFFENTSLEEGAQEKVLISEIIANPEQPRKFFRQESISSLAESIRQHGVIQPIILKRQADGSYLIVAGERRWRAAKLAGLLEIPAVVREFSEQQVLQISLLENLQREDLSPIDEARSFSALLEILDCGQEELANTLSVARCTISNSLRLLTLPDEIKKMVDAGKLTAGHAKCLLAGGLEKCDRLKIARIVAEKGLSVRETDLLVKRAQDQGQVAPKGGKAAINCKPVKEDLSRLIGREVKALYSGGKYRVSFCCNSYDELEEVVKRLKQKEG